MSSIFPFDSSSVDYWNWIYCYKRSIGPLCKNTQLKIPTYTKYCSTDHNYFRFFFQNKYKMISIPYSLFFLQGKWAHTILLECIEVFTSTQEHDYLFISTIIVTCWLFPFLNSTENVCFLTSQSSILHPIFFFEHEVYSSK